MSFKTEASGCNITTWAVANHREPQVDSSASCTLVNGYGWGRVLLHHVRDCGLKA